MTNKPRNNPLLEELIDNLSNDPKEVKVFKKPSVRDEIIDLRKNVGDKVFTKRQLKELIEAGYPELAPVAMSNLDASMSRASSYLECVYEAKQNVYAYIQDEA